MCRHARQSRTYAENARSLAYYDEPASPCLSGTRTRSWQCFLTAMSHVIAVDSLPAQYGSTLQRLAEQLIGRERLEARRDAPCASLADTFSHGAQ
jgi:hypothetical protein